MKALVKTRKGVGHVEVPWDKFAFKIVDVILTGKGSSTTSRPSEP